MQETPATDQPALPHYRPALDGLRAVAVLAVVGFHAFPSLVPGGFVGVDVFFVISGYLITGILLRGRENRRFTLREFYARRIRRIFPALLIVMATCLGLGLTTLPPHEFQQLAKHVAGGAGFIANFLLWNEAGYFDTASATKPLMHLWSLGIEEQFYIVWPVLLFTATRTRISIFWMTLLITLGSFIFNLSLGASHEIADFYSPLSRFWELAAGGLLASLLFKPSKHWKQHIGERQDLFSCLGLALLALSFFIFNKADIYPGWRALLPVTGTWLLVASDKGWINRNILAQRVAVALGLISYPLYLWHWPLLSFLRIEEGSEATWLMRIAAVLLALLLSALTYQLIEKPIRLGPNPRGKTICLCIFMALLGSSAFYLNHPQGNGLSKNYTDQLIWTSWNDQACAEHYGVAPCQTNSASPKVLILGDSHGNHLYPGLAAALPRAGVLWAGTCLPLDGIFLHVTKNQSDNPCEHTDFLSINKHILRENPGIKTVIISGRLRHLLNNSFSNEHENDLWGKVWLASIVPGEEDKNNTELIRIGLERTLRYLSSQKLNILYVRGTPEIGPELSDYCQLMSSAAPMSCTVSKASYLHDRQAEDQLLAELKQKFPQLLVYDPINRLCDDDACYLMKNGMLLFRDFHHLSAAGSALLGQDIKGFMQRKGLLN